MPSVLQRLDAESHLISSIACGNPTLASDMHQNGPLCQQTFPGQVESNSCSHSLGRTSNTVETSYFRRPIPLAAIILLALAVHGPLLVMQLPLNTSYDANFHIFFASHYAQHWFDPWNGKWFAGFSQTTYPPLGHQWIALFSYVVGLKMAYMLVQLIALLLLPVGVYRFARLWVDERASSYAALFSVFLG